MNGDILISVIIPVYNSEKTIEKCLKSILNSQYKHFEVIVVDDNSSDRSLNILQNTVCSSPYFVIKMNKNLGAAAARNQGAAKSSGEILLFIDSDILIETNALNQVVETFQTKPEISALFCSYQKNTAASNFFSVYKNLIHHYTHQTAREQAATFWSGFGAIKRKVFLEIGGFNESYRNLEDIELGYRLYQCGHYIYLNKAVQVTHCKEYDITTLIKSDVFNRAIPWTKLMLNKKVFKNDLNTKLNNVFSVLVAFAILLNFPLLYAYSLSLYTFVVLILFFFVLNRDFYAFLYHEKGSVFTIKAVLMNWFTYLYSGIGLILGIIVYWKDYFIKLKM